MFYRLKVKDIFYLLMLIILTYFWMANDQVFLHEAYQRMIAFPIIGMGLMSILFLLVKPARPFTLANTMAIILIPILILASIILHVCIFKDGFQTKSILLWFMVAGMIYLSGLLYSTVRKG